MKIAGNRLKMSSGKIRHFGDTMKTLQAKNFNSRKDLDNAVEKDTEVIKGTREELARLSLNDLRKINGVKVEITNDPTPVDKLKEKPNRGELFISKLNSQEVKYGDKNL